ncbi:MAG: PilZ domain-containing protein [Candidatus Omnitrophota bacterium]
MKKGGPIAEKRKFNRIITADVAVSYKLYNTQTLPMYQEMIEEDARNISLGGIAFKTHALLPVDTPIGLTIRFGKTAPIKTFGRVAWISQSEGLSQYNVGIRFSWWVSNEDRKILNNYIDKQLPPGSSN